MAPNPIESMRFGGIYGPKPCKFIGFGDIYGPKPYKFIGFGGIHVEGAPCENGNGFENSAVHWQFGILIFQVFGRFPAKLGPKTPLERRGSSCSAGCSKNQPRRPILRPFVAIRNSEITPPQ